MARPAAGLAHHYGSRSRTDADSRSRLPSCVYPIALAAPLGRFRLRRTERALREYVASGKGKIRSEVCRVKAGHEGVSG